MASLSTNPLADVPKVSPTESTTTGAAVGSMFDKANTDNGASNLGTLEHWDQVYTRELQAFSSAATTLSAPSNEDSGCGRDGDAGECWYGDDVTSKMVELILPYCVPTARVLDIGTGNGDLICRLVESAPMSWYIGTDYSANAVKLAKAVTEARGGQQEEKMLKESYKRVEFLIDDVLNTTLRDNSVDVFLDKGTLDALSCLYGDYRGTERIVVYLNSLARLGRQGVAVLALTCANFTRKELSEMMSDAGWEYVEHVKYRIFSFGGGSGEHVSTTLYRLVK